MDLDLEAVDKLEYDINKGFQLLIDQITNVVDLKSEMRLTLFVMKGIERLFQIDIPNSYPYSNHYDDIYEFLISFSEIINEKIQISNDVKIVI